MKTMTLLLRTVGPLTPPHKTARSNMRMCMPEMSEADIEGNLRAMWDNFASESKPISTGIDLSVPAAPSCRQALAFS